MENASIIAQTDEKVQHTPTSLTRLRSLAEAEYRRITDARERLEAEEAAARMTERNAEFKKFLADTFGIDAEPVDAKIDIDGFTFQFCQKTWSSDYGSNPAGMIALGPCDAGCGRSVRLTDPFNRISDLHALGYFFAHPRGEWCDTCRNQDRKYNKPETTEQRLLSVLREYISDVIGEDRP